MLWCVSPDQELEKRIAECQFQEIWIETATVLQEAVKLYESNGYQLTTGVETKCCDRVYEKIVAQIVDCRF